jgi:glycine oxidase
LADVVIVGGGVIGCATAYYLAREGASVTVLERGEIAGEASGAAAGMLAALSDEGDRPPAFRELCDASLALYEMLLPELAKTGIDVYHRRSGVLHVAFREDDLPALRRRREQSPEGRWLEGREVQREEPEVSRRAVAAYLSLAEQYVDPQRLTQALAEAARASGVTLKTGVGVNRFLRAGSSLRGVTAGGETYAADAVLLAGGPWTAALARRLGAYVPVRPVRGQMLSLKGPAQPLRHMIWGEGAYLIPREEGQTFVGATVEEAGYRKRTTVSALRSLRRGANALIPSLRSAVQLHAWAGLRPGSPDHLAIMGLLPGWENVWVSTGHFRNGILQAPASGRLVAHSILAGRPLPELAPFSPRRFRD